MTEICYCSGSTATRGGSTVVEVHIHVDSIVVDVQVHENSIVMKLDPET